MRTIAVIDTETNWADQVMSIGTVIADAETFRAVDARYHIFPQECEIGGMYSDVLYLETPVKPIVCPRGRAMAELAALFEHYGVEAIFAYNAKFDWNHLPELRHLPWFDIMRIAAYRQTNPYLPTQGLYCSTGRLKTGYGVEPMHRLLTGDRRYHETHNAYWDAFDELTILRHLGRRAEDYIPL